MIFNRVVEPGGLGRRVPTDFKHVEKFPMRFLAPGAPAEVNKILHLPWWHGTHDQGNEGACVGFGSSMMMAVLNTEQRRVAGERPYTVRYDPWWLWDRSKEIDEWDDTNPGDDNGTSVRASCEVIRTLGLPRYEKVWKLLAHNSRDWTPDGNEGIATYRWAVQVDEMRSAIAAGLPVSIGVNWYSNFDRPQKFSGYYWIGTESSDFHTSPVPTGNLGQIRGGHCVTIYGASDKRQAFRVKNSWGRDYPLVWLPYSVMGRLLGEYGEAAIITDR